MALISALMMVATAVMMTSLLAWQSLLGTSRAENNRDRDQSVWIARAAAGYGQWVLEVDMTASDGRSSALTDHLAEPWAQTLTLTSFKDFFNSKSPLEHDIRLDQARFGGRMHDLQGRLNLAIMMRDGRLLSESLEPLRLLFKFHGLGEASLQEFVAHVSESLKHTSPRSANDAPKRQRVISEGLARLDLPGPARQRLLQQLSWLPEPTQVNVNTADPEVIAAVIEAENPSVTDNLIQVRQRLPFLTIAEARGTLATNTHLSFHRLDVSSNYFLALGIAEYGKASIQFQAWYQRFGGRVSMLNFQVL